MLSLIILPPALNTDTVYTGSHRSTILLPMHIEEIQKDIPAIPVLVIL